MTASSVGTGAAGHTTGDTAAEAVAAAEALREAGERERRAAHTALVRAFHRARHDEELVVLEGFHPLKHALRFGAGVELVVSAEGGELTALVADHAPELAATIDSLAVTIPREEFKRLGPYEPHTGVVSLARRRQHDPAQMLADTNPAPLVLLEDPRHRGNLGAVIRVAAAGEAAGVLVLGGQDPWHPVVVRGSAGLHFALPVARIDRLPSSVGAGETVAGGVVLTDRPIVVLDPEGDPYGGELLPERAILAFGSERRGVSGELRARAHTRLRLPMREGVSSLNLATSVAAALYGMRLGDGDRGR